LARAAALAFLPRGQRPSGAPFFGVRFAGDAGQSPASRRLKVDAGGADWLGQSSSSGTNGKRSCGVEFRDGGRRGRRLVYLDGSSWTTRPSMPPATVTISPLTCPDISSEASTTT